ncbi:MAG: RloB family protein [Bacillota bacterium]
MAAKQRFIAKERRPVVVYRGAYEGKEQERQYLYHLKSLIFSCEGRKRDVDFIFVSACGGGPISVVERAVRVPLFYPREQTRTAIFDYDGKTEEFKKALDCCKDQDIEYTYTNYCFDLWLILHKKRFIRSIVNPKEYEREIKTLYNIPPNADIKSHGIMERIIAQITLSDIKFAIQNGQAISLHQDQVGTPLFTDKSIKYYNNPDLLIHRFVEKVLKDTGCLS